MSASVTLLQKESFIPGDAAPFRVLDMRELLARPQEPIPWVCDHLLASGTLTTLVGPPGLGKSWLGLLLAAGVHDGGRIGGIQCALGHALYFDGENGERIIKARFHAAQLTEDAMTMVDADRLDLAREDHLAAVTRQIEQSGASLVVFDSLKRLTPNTRESENDEMAPVIAALARVARRTDAAVLLLHHKSVKADSADFRGASAIQDQSDMLFVLHGTTDRFKLYDLKFRVGESPAPRWLGIRPAGGYVSIEAVEGGYVEKPTKQRAFMSAILDLAHEVGADHWLPARFAAELGTDGREHKTVKRALDELVKDEGWEYIPHTGYRPPQA